MSSAGRAGCSQHASVRFLSDEQLGRKFAIASLLLHSTSEALDTPNQDRQWYLTCFPVTVTQAEAGLGLKHKTLFRSENFLSQRFVTRRDNSSRSVLEAISRVLYYRVS